MIIICDKCQAKYQIDDLHIKKTRMLAKCKFCSNQLLIEKPREEKLQEAPPTESAEKQYAQQTDEQIDTESATIPDTVSCQESASHFSQENELSQKKSPGIRGKMFFFFFVIPALLIALICALLYYQFNSYSQSVKMEAAALDREISEKLVCEQAKATARQVNLYLDSLPNISVNSFGYDRKFARVVLHKVGKSGTTALAAIQGKEEPWKILIHEKDELKGNDVLSEARGYAFPGSLQQIKRLYAKAAQTNKLTTCYYNEKNGDDAYLVLAPVEGTTLWIIVRARIDEFGTTAAQRFDEKSKSYLQQTTQYALIAILIALILLLLLVIVFSGKLSRKILSEEKTDSPDLSSPSADQEIQV